jgi:hypothetical protein
LYANSSIENKKKQKELACFSPLSNAQVLLLQHYICGCMGAYRHGALTGMEPCGIPTTRYGPSTQFVSTSGGSHMSAHSRNSSKGSTSTSTSTSVISNATQHHICQVSYQQA